MCGRFIMASPVEKVAAHFAVPDPPPLKARYNIAPSQPIAVVGLKADGQRRGIGLLRWGLVPSWADDPNKGPKPINVRSESVLKKFRDQLRYKRCIIPADGFYEWRADGPRKKPYRFGMKDGSIFGFAGVWDVWGAGTGNTVVTCALLTTTPNALV